MSTTTPREPRSSPGPLPSLPIVRTNLPLVVNTDTQLLDSSLTSCTMPTYRCCWKSQYCYCTGHSGNTPCRFTLTSVEDVQPVVCCQDHELALHTYEKGKSMPYPICICEKGIPRPLATLHGGHLIGCLPI